MSEAICVCGCPWNRHYLCSTHHGEHLGCVDCICKAFEENEVVLNDSKPPKLFFPEGY